MELFVLPPFFSLLLFLFLGNMAPPLASLLLGDRLNTPIDLGLKLKDNEFLFGPHKTFRGLAAGLLAAILLAPLLGISFGRALISMGLLLGGDLLSSFLKRRLHKKSGSAMFGLDQLFEALFPSLYLGHHLELPLWQTLACVCFFVPAAHAGALFWKSLLKRPDPGGAVRIVRSTVRLKEWRACHQPVARWHALFNLESLLTNELLLKASFKAVGLYDQGMANALKPELRKIQLAFSDLPEEFDGFTILLLTDLHLDGAPGLTDRIIEKVGELSADICLIGGDIRMRHYGPIAPCLRRLKRLTPVIRARQGIFGVLGNHDCIEMVPDLAEAGVQMLVNEGVAVERGGSRLWIGGVDDPHYYRTGDVGLSLRGRNSADFSILLAHSPELYLEAEKLDVRLYLCGHTHGGQVRFKNGRPIFTNSRAPRFTAEGVWRYRSMIGYTSRGAGASSVPVRFNCPGEITLITLKQAGQ